MRDPIVLLAAARHDAELLDGRDFDAAEWDRLDEWVRAVNDIVSLADKQTAEWERYNAPAQLPLPVQEMRAQLTRVAEIRSRS